MLNNFWFCIEFKMMVLKIINVANRGSIALCFCSSRLVYHVHYGSRMYLLYWIGKATFINMAMG